MFDVSVVSVRQFGIHPVNQLREPTGTTYTHTTRRSLLIQGVPRSSLGAAATFFERDVCYASAFFRGRSSERASPSTGKA